MDGNLGNIPGTLKESAGLALFGLSALDSLRSPGGLQHLLQTRALLTQDPGARAALQGSPFLSGALGFTGGFAPETPPGIAATRMQQAGIAPGTFVPSMGRLNPEAFVASRLAGAQAQALTDPDVMAQAARHTLGVQPPGLTPEQLESYRGAMGPGETLNVPVGGGARMGLRGRFAGGGEAPFGYIRDDVSGRLVRDPRIAGARAPAAGATGVGAPTLPGYVRDPATGKLVRDLSPEAAAQHAAAVAGAKPPTVQVEQELSQIQTLDGLIDDAEKLLETPEVQRSVGFVAGRAGFLAYKAGALSDPLPIEFNTIRELVKILSIGRLARAAGSRSYQVWRELDIHPPQAGDNITELRTKLNSLRHVLRRSAAATANVAQTPRSRLGTIVAPDAPLGGAQGAPATAPTPGTEILPGVRYLGPSGG